MSSSVRDAIVPFGTLNSPNRANQAPNGKYDAFRDRLQAAAREAGLNQASLAKSLGLTSGTFSRYWSGDRLPPADTLLDLADIVSVPASWLIRGGERRSNLLAGVEDADWVQVPEYDLRELTDETRGQAVSTTPVRKDWLNRIFGQSTGLWLARLPADLPRFELREGDLVFLRDTELGEAQDGAVYIVRVWGHLTVARLDALLSSQMNAIERNLEDRRLAPRDIGTEDGQAILVARVLGAPLRRL